MLRVLLMVVVTVLSPRGVSVPVKLGPEMPPVRFRLVPLLPARLMPPEPLSVIAPLQVLLPLLEKRVERMSPVLLDGRERELATVTPPWTATRVPVGPAPPVVLLTT